MNLQMHEDKDWLQGLASGNRKATEHLYAVHRKPVIGWIVKRGGNETDAEDVFHEAMVVLFEKAQQESFRLTCKVSTYLFAVSKHLWYKKMQVNSRLNISLTDEQELESESQWEFTNDLAAHHEREEMYAQMGVAMEQLGAPCNQLLKAYYIEQKSMKEIADQFGYTNPENAKNQKYKCLNRLKKLFYAKVMG